MRQVQLLVCLFCLLAPTSALAAMVRFCVSIDVDYVDAGGGDNWTDNSVHKAARGFEFKLQLAGQSSTTSTTEVRGCGCCPSSNVQIRAVPTVPRIPAPL